jgi:xanthine dehydrogenase accessory factor
MLIAEKGSITETIGGGLAEAMIIEKSADILAAYKNGSAKPVLVHVDMAGQNVADEGMICGGAIEVLLEVV